LPANVAEHGSNLVANAQNQAIAVYVAVEKGVLTGAVSGAQNLLV
jgi:hypothetical protein